MENLMSSMNDPYSGDAAHAHDDVDYEALELAQFEQSAAAQEHEPEHLPKDAAEPDRDFRRPGAGPEEAEASALAHHADPSNPGKAQRRARLEQQVRGRTAVRWVPATELIHRSTATLAGHGIWLQSKGHRFVRDAALKAAVRRSVAAGERIGPFGQARPLRNAAGQPAMRSAVTLGARPFSALGGLSDSCRSWVRDPTRRR